MLMSTPFWKMKSLEEMSKPEWESLCDGCGKCCLVQLEDEETGLRLKTDIACRLFDNSTCRCKDYEHRKTIVPECVVLDPDKARNLDWMPRTCAYRLVADGEDLPDWHHLVCGDAEAIHRAGYSVIGQTVSEDEIDEAEAENHIVDWPGEA